MRTMGVNAHLCVLATPTWARYERASPKPPLDLEPRASTQPSKLTTHRLQPSSGHLRLGGRRTGSAVRASGLVGLARGGVDWALRGHVLIVLSAARLGYG
jgi:hypothetical protein